MVSVLARAAGVILCLVVMVSSGSGSDARPEPQPAFDNASGARITDYQVDVTLGRNGSYREQHKLTMNVPEGFHGIVFRNTVRTNNDRVRFVVDDISMRLDGSTDHTRVWRDRDRRYSVLLLGNDDEALSPGQHVFDFGFRIENQLRTPVRSLQLPSFGRNEGALASELSRAPTGGWEFPIRQLTMTYHLPDPSTVAFCTVQGGQVCNANDDTKNTVVFTAQKVPAGASINVIVGLPRAAPTLHTVPWSPESDAVFGQTLEGAGRLLVLAVVAGMAGGILAARGKQPPTSRRAYEPPLGMGPAPAAVLLGVAKPDRLARATMLELRAADYLAPTGTGFGDAADVDEWDRLDPATRDFGRALVGGASLQEAGKQLVSDSRRWLVERDFLAVDRLTQATRLVLVPAAALLALVFMLLNPQRMSLLGLPFAAFVVFASPLLFPGRGLRRTPSGRALWTQVAGFRQTLAAPSAGDRLDELMTESLYRSYAGWAVAFGCLDAWSRRYAAVTGEPPPRLDDSLAPQT